MFDPLRPYNALPLLPPASELETKAVLKRCVLARTALAELKVAGLLIPDQSVLINSITMLETKDSSAIENIVTTTDALFRQVNLVDDAGDPVAREALRYRTALYQGFQSLRQRPLTTRTAVEICRTITAITLDIRKTPGTTLTNTFTGEAMPVPRSWPSICRSKAASKPLSLSTRAAGNRCLSPPMSVWRGMWRVMSPRPNVPGAVASTYS